MNQCARFGLVSALVLTFGCSTSSGPSSSIRETAGANSTAGGAEQGAGGSGNSMGGLSINVGGQPPAAAGSAGNDGTSCDGRLTGYIRDFLAATHQDFEPWTVDSADHFPNRYMPLKVDPFSTIASPTSTCQDGANPVTPRACLETGIVQATLDPTTQKPAYAKGDGMSSLTTTGQANFDQWFKDVPGTNMGMELPLQFVTDPTDPTGKTYVYDSRTLLGGSFFPIDNKLLSPTLPAEGFGHNYSFTFELHTKFAYSPGQKFNFQGDDDVWVFINNKLVVDLGGIHNMATANVDLDSLGLTAGSTYPLDFFYAERHCCASNFVMSTSITFTDCGVVVK